MCITATVHCDPGWLLGFALLHVKVEKKKKKRMLQQAEISFNCLLLLLSTVVVPPLTSVPLFLCAPPSPVRLHRSLPL